ncbi:MAG: hypothetical protein NZ805_06635 [Armatimonadetes bacterium]|nr:hypothetical protein [Armatimonadota bacterium]MDW8026761.1 hypothetical protein [Armatimonadota bacterium]
MPKFLLPSLYTTYSATPPFDLHQRIWSLGKRERFILQIALVNTSRRLVLRTARESDGCG